MELPLAPGDPGPVRVEKTELPRLNPVTVLLGCLLALVLASAIGGLALGLRSTASIPELIANDAPCRWQIVSTSGTPAGLDTFEVNARRARDPGDELFIEREPDFIVIAYRQCEEAQ